jgi:hypothetical protein
MLLVIPGPQRRTAPPEQVLMQQLRGLGMDVKAARNGALHDLIKEIDPRRWRTYSATRRTR